jgi:hypothetical protein
MRLTRTVYVAPIVALVAAGCFQSHPPLTPAEKYQKAQQALSAAKDPKDRYSALEDAAKSALDVDEREKTKAYATGLLELAQAQRGDWNYGNATHGGHVVLERLALVDGDRESAKRHLLAAGGTAGSPQLGTFGPNMTLARDLIKAGEKDAVLQYFDLCRKFWKAGPLDKWTKDVQSGAMPDFGANLLY